MATPIALVEHPAEHVLFDGALTCDVVLPAHFDTGARVVMQGNSSATAAALVDACALNAVATPIATCSARAVPVC